MLSILTKNEIHRRVWVNPTQQQLSVRELAWRILARTVKINTACIALSPLKWEWKREYRYDHQVTYWGYVGLIRRSRSPPRQALVSCTLTSTWTFSPASRPLGPQGPCLASRAVLCRIITVIVQVRVFIAQLIPAPDCKSYIAHTPHVLSL